MKSLLGLILCAIFAECLVIEPRQLGAGSIASSLASFIPGIDGVKRQSQPKTRRDAIRQIIRYGPFALPPTKITSPTPAVGPHNGHKPPSESGGNGSLMDLIGAATKPMDPAGFTLLKRLKTSFCNNCTVLTGEVTVVSEDGSPASVQNGVYLHHVTVLDASKASQKFITDCGNAASSIVAFLAAGIDGSKREFSSPDGQYPSGFYIKNDTFIMQAEFVNSRTITQNVFVDMDIEYLLGKVGEEAMPMKLSATDCSSTTLSYTPKGNEAGQLKSGVYPMHKDGIIVVPHGHMHDGGTAVSMFVNGSLICKSTASYEGSEQKTISNMSYCNKSTSVKKGDEITITADYDLKAHPARDSHGEGQEIMGMMMFVFVPKKV